MAAPAHTPRIPTTMADMAEAAKHSYIERPVSGQQARARTVVLVAVSSGYIDFFRNWLYYYRRLGLGMFMVIAEDQAAFETLYNDESLNLKGRLISAFDDDIKLMETKTENSSQAFSYRSTGFNLLMARRPSYLLQLSQLGYDVLMTDVDIVWLQDPFPYFADPVYSLHVQSDPERVTDKPDKMLCAGFVLFVSNNNTHYLLKQWSESLKLTANRGSNQIPFFIRVTNMRDVTHKETFQVNILPIAQFVNGAMYFNPEWRREHPAAPVTVHNNWISGHDAKKNRFIENGLWHDK